jgi:hypothetical protein
MHERPETIENWHVAKVALRKSIVITVLWAVCALAEQHHIFSHVGKMGEFAFGSIADHAFFDWFK